MWFDEAVIYQIYPIGFCGAPNCGVENEEQAKVEREKHRILKVIDWIPHIVKTGANTVLFNPLFESEKHGYDTRDYSVLDARLGTNEDFALVCKKLHEAGLKIMLDGVFNHVGRGFWAFNDVKEKRWDSPYKDYFNISFEGNTHFNDGFWYEGWEGCMDLVKLNLNNDAVINHQFECISNWVREFDIDGLRLDVAYCLDKNYLRRLRSFANSVKPDFVLMGETLHGDYNFLMNDEMCHSVTNYEAYKGIWSSFNSENMFEIGYSLNRQFGPDHWTLYKGKHLLSFVDNHDVTRIASVLSKQEHLPLCYALIMTMPGVPCIYYGSEFGVKGDKKDSDYALRPCISKPEYNELTEYITKLSEIHKSYRALCYGGYRQIACTNKQLVFERACEGERIVIAINASSDAYDLHFDAGCGTAKELISGQAHDFGGGSKLAPFSANIWLMER